MITHSDIQLEAYYIAEKDGFFEKPEYYWFLAEEILQSIQFIIMSEMTESILSPTIYNKRDDKVSRIIKERKKLLRDFCSLLKIPMKYNDNVKEIFQRNT